MILIFFPGQKAEKFDLAADRKTLCIISSQFPSGFSQINFGVAQVICAGRLKCEQTRITTHSLSLSVWLYCPFSNVLFRRPFPHQKLL